MLDECKGERLEEVLAAFSSAVLKKMVAQQRLGQREFPAVAQSCALEDRGYTGERTELGILVLAHRASLTRHLREKNVARAQFHSLLEVLERKERALVRRREQARALEAQEKEAGVLSEITDNVKLDVWRNVRNNWSGNEQWMETLLYGDEHAQKDPVLSAPFDRVWRRVETGRLNELEDRSSGLLQQLDKRVRAQKDRLAKWQDFRARILGKVRGAPVEDVVQPSNRQKGVDLGFIAHENLHLGRMSPRKLPRGKPGKLTAEYTDVIDGLQSELNQTAKGSSIPSYLTTTRDKPVYETEDSAVEEVVSEISELEEELPRNQRDEEELQSFQRNEPYAAESHSSEIHSTKRLAASPELNMPSNLGSQIGKRTEVSRVTPMEEEQAFTPRPGLSRMATGSQPDWDVCPASATPTRAPRRPQTPGSQSPIRGTSFPIRTSPPKQASPERYVSPLRESSYERQPSPKRNISPTQELADQILASMNAASPSPVKKPRHTLSLAERTRLSMARRTSKVPVLDEDDEPDLDATLRISPVRRVPTDSEDSGYSTHHNNPSITPTEEEQPYEDLVSRTRRSMAGFEASRKKAQLERRRSQRQSKQLQPGHRRDGSSYFPSVNEEGQDTTLLLAEELMSKEVDDPEAIFKSRPRIKTSPVATPTREWD